MWPQAWRSWQRAPPAMQPADERSMAENKLPIFRLLAEVSSLPSLSNSKLYTRAVHKLAPKG
jgi:hypothetical protein